MLALCSNQPPVAIQGQPRHPTPQAACLVQDVREADPQILPIVQRPASVVQLVQIITHPSLACKEFRDLQAAPGTGTCCSSFQQLQTGGLRLQQFRVSAGCRLRA